MVEGDARRKALGFFRKRRVQPEPLDVLADTGDTVATFEGYYLVTCPRCATTVDAEVT